MRKWQNLTVMSITPPVALFDTLAHWQDTKINSLHAQDHQYAKDFIYSYRGSKATFSAYRREIERFLQWAWHIANTSIKNVKRSDIENFIDFCQHPPESWIAKKNVARFTNHQGQRQAASAWRPFVIRPNVEHYQLSEKALRAVFAVLGSFYNYLIQEDYIAYNPVSQIRQKSRYFRKKQSKTVIRRLTELQWSYVIETAELMAAQDPEKHERTLFIMNALFGMYLRISELAANENWQPQMGDFKRDLDGHWWFTTVGKGNKERDISVSDAMLSALKRYRKSLGLAPSPTLGESTPLITTLNHKGAITSTRHIRLIVQHCFDQTCERLRQDGFTEETEQLQAATVHWIRHTGISEDVKHRPREHVRDDAGHSSSLITDKYIDIEKRARHASAKKKVIKPID
ncbi:MAG: site-specific integrase [Gammaproteobacteria bacterium]